MECELLRDDQVQVFLSKDQSDGPRVCGYVFIISDKKSRVHPSTCHQLSQGPGPSAKGLQPTNPLRQIDWNIINDLKCVTSPRGIRFPTIRNNMDVCKTNHWPKKKAFFVIPLYRSIHCRFQFLLWYRICLCEENVHQKGFVVSTFELSA